MAPPEAHWRLGLRSAAHVMAITCHAVSPVNTMTPIADIAKCSAELWMKKALTRNPMKMPMKPISSAGSSPDSSARR